MEVGLDRAGFLALSARGGAVVAVGAIGAGLLVDGAAARTVASGQIADLDLAIARLAVGAEVLAAEFYTHAIAADTLGEAETGHLKRALFNEQEHLKAVTEILTGAGQTAATADDFTVAFPRRSFDSPGSIARLGVTLETAFVAAYLGAVDAFSAADLKTTAARIAANEAQHLSVFANLAANRPVGVSFPSPIDYETASDLFDAYLS
jgi:hypothetical protein